MPLSYEAFAQLRMAHLSFAQEERGLSRRSAALGRIGVGEMSEKVPVSSPSWESQIERPYALETEAARRCVYLHRRDAGILIQHARPSSSSGLLWLDSAASRWQPLL
jgi:hypothetical protein